MPKKASDGHPHPMAACSVAEKKCIPVTASPCLEPAGPEPGALARLP